jgi:hypothetical protein
MVLEIRSGKHPHEVAMLLAGLLLGVAGAVFFDETATTTARALPYPFGHIMYAGLGLGCAIALTGVFWHGLTGALVERAGLVSVSIWSLIYGAVVAINSGVRAVGFGGFMLAFAVASLIRVKQIGVEARQMEATRMLLDQPPGDDR